MSFTVSAQVVRTSAPSTTDDASKGFVVGSVWVNSTPSPYDLYICSSAAVGAATWVLAVGANSHPDFTTLGWSASGHTGTASSAATFDSASGAPVNAQASVDGTVLTFSGGLLKFAPLLVFLALNCDTLALASFPHAEVAT